MSAKMWFVYDDRVGKLSTYGMTAGKGKEQGIYPGLSKK